MTAAITFTPTAAHQTIETFIRFQAGPNLWQSIPITPPANNACVGMSPGCPTAAGAPQTYNLSVPIPTAGVPQIGTTNFEGKI